MSSTPTPSHTCHKCVRPHLTPPLLRGHTHTCRMLWADARSPIAHGMRSADIRTATTPHRWANGRVIGRYSNSAVCHRVCRTLYGWFCVAPQQPRQSVVCFGLLDVMIIDERQGVSRPGPGSRLQVRVAMPALLPRNYSAVTQHRAARRCPPVSHRCRLLPSSSVSPLHSILIPGWSSQARQPSTFTCALILTHTL